MRAILSTAIAFFFAARAFAASDLTISLTADKTNVTTGEELTLVLRIKNNGPDAASNLNVNFGNSFYEPMHVLSAPVFPGWDCEIFEPYCFGRSLAAGAEVELPYHILTPTADRGVPFSFNAVMDTVAGRERAELPLTLQESTYGAELSISVSAPPDPIQQNEEVTFAHDVRNDGPNDLADVRVTFSVGASGWFVSDLTPVYEGAGWTCTPYAFGATCQRELLAAKGNAPLAVRLTMPAFDGQASVRSVVFSSQSHFDPFNSNNFADRTVVVGTAGNWSCILVPFASAETPGAHGSLWKTEIRGLIESDTYPEFAPSDCGTQVDPCSLPPLRRVFDAAEDDLLSRGTGPQFLYVRREDASKVTFTTRVYDSSKSETTAGAFIPMARKDDFSTEGLSLFGIPVAPEFRSTLRICTPRARRTNWSISPSTETTRQRPFLRTTLTLTNVDGQVDVTSAFLPRYPASVQVDLSSLIPPGLARAPDRPATSGHSGHSAIPTAGGALGIRQHHEQ